MRDDKGSLGTSTFLELLPRKLLVFYTEFRVNDRWPLLAATQKRSFNEPLACRNP